jgi:oxygen-dependent protoporphyrinogen oxidase
MNSKNSTDIAIIGAGISGLSLAYFLKRKGLKVQLLEKSDRVGGAINTLKEDGYLFEAGPNTVQESSEAFIELSNDLKLNTTRSNEFASNRFILTKGGLKKVPLGPKAAIKSDLIPWSEKLHFVMKEFFPKFTARAPQKNESVQEFATRNFGENTFNNLIQPFLNGILAQDGNSTSAEALFKDVVRLEKDTGSIIRAMKAKKKSKKPSPEKRKSSPGLVSFPNGLSELSEKLLLNLKEETRTEQAVDMIFHQGDLWHCSDENGNNIASAKSIVITTPTYVSSRLLREPKLNDIEYNPLTVLGLGFHCKEISHPLDGFGFLTKSDADYPFLGCIWSSSLFSSRAPKDHLILNFFIGGETQKELTSLDEQELTKLCCEGLKRALNLNKVPSPSKVFCRKYKNAIPKFAMEHQQRLSELEKFEKTHPGLHFLGNFKGGVSLNDRILRSSELAEKLSI